MKRETEIALIERLLEHAEANTTSMADAEARIPVSAYLSPERFARETQALFRERPVIVAHTSEVAHPGDLLTHDLLGVPIVVLRDRDGVLRAFLNVCRHRGSRVVSEDRSAGKKALVCGYHGWSYNLDGSLLHIPHEAGFPRTDCDRGLVPLPVAEHAGFFWVVPSASSGPLDAAAFLGGLADELTTLGLAGHTVHRSVNVRRRFHWKLIIDAFLDGYHVRHLHRNSVYRFFLDNVSLSDPFPPHLRSVVARKSIRDATTTPKEAWKLRDYLSLTYFLFPNTVLVFHPDWVSRITLFPVSLEETVFTHTMLIPAAAAATPAPGEAEERRAHWEKTWTLIHEGVFEREDIAAAESIQSGLSSGANEAFSVGRFEFPLRLFHDSVDRALAGA
jgi:phenylpropionate dioxygenase-like ring-hydroxylating dioxygenase large terminal subunit